LALALAGLIATYSVFTGSNPLQSIADYLVLTALSTATLFCFYRMTVPRILAGPASFLGNVSYALYLTHPLVFTICQNLSACLGLGSYSAAVSFFVAALAIAQITFLSFERPMRSLLRGH
jgi:peptidoglycan/LPS O-acetylase OafA/YrhL